MKAVFVSITHNFEEPYTIGPFTVIDFFQKNNFQTTYVSNYFSKIQMREYTHYYKYDFEHEIILNDHEQEFFNDICLAIDEETLVVGFSSPP